MSFVPLPPSGLPGVKSQPPALFAARVPAFWGTRAGGGGPAASLPGCGKAQGENIHGNTSQSLRTPRKLFVVVSVTTWMCVCGGQRGGSQVTFRFWNPGDAEGGESRAGKGGWEAGDGGPHPARTSK